MAPTIKSPRVILRRRTSLPRCGPFVCVCTPLERSGCWAAGHGRSCCLYALVCICPRCARTVALRRRVVCPSRPAVALRCVDLVGFEGYGKQFGGVFEAYRGPSLWFDGIELAITILNVGIAGVVPTTTGVSTAKTAGYLALSAIRLALLGFLMPFRRGQKLCLVCVIDGLKASWDGRGVCILLGRRTVCYICRESSADGCLGSHTNCTRVSGSGKVKRRRWAMQPPLAQRCHPIRSRHRFYYPSCFSCPKHGHEKNRRCNRF